MTKILEFAAVFFISFLMVFGYNGYKEMQRAILERNATIQEQLEMIQVLTVVLEQCGVQTIPPGQFRAPPLLNGGPSAG